MKVCIIGTGYVGLVSGACLAKLGNEVVCVDNNEAKIAMLNNNQVPIFEPDLAGIIKEARANNNIYFTMELKKSIQAADIIFICVGTPAKPSGEADLSLVFQVAENIGKYLNGFKVIVNKSTAPVGTAKKIGKIIKQSINRDIPFQVASVPEFLREGSAVYDTFNPERIVIGTECDKTADILKELHKPLNAPILITNLETAEMIKYASNTFLATKISFINGIASICTQVGADVTEVAKGMGLDTRIGSKFLNAGIGFGGACFPKDTKALLHLSEEVNAKFTLLEEVLNINYGQRQKVVKILNQKLKSINGKKIGILGLSFKPNTDDLREAPSLDIIKEIITQGGQVICYDPIAMEEAKRLLPTNVSYANHGLETAVDSDALVLVTEWEEFKKLDMQEVVNVMQGNVFIDGRNVYEPKEMMKLGFDYSGVGR